MKIALVHDWLLAQRGGEKVLAELTTIFPDAPIYTLLYKEKYADALFKNKKIYTSLAQKLPFVQKYYRYLLPVYPTLIERFKVKDYDVVLSLNHCVAKGVLVGSSTHHICYCFTPMRYLWDQYDRYFGKHPVKRFFVETFLFKYLRKWDVASAARVNEYLAISQFVADRIKEYYRRDAVIIHPPVNTEFFTPDTKPSEDFFLIVSALVPYKNIDVAIEAFNETGHKLKIIGKGPERTRLHKLAKQNIEFIEWVDETTLRTYYRKCIALVLPSEEEFGIVVGEAQACGKPVIISKKGGALDAIIPRKTGIYFESITKSAIIEALNEFFRTTFSSELIRKHSENFSKALFKENIEHFIATHVKK